MFRLRLLYDVYMNFTTYGKQLAANESIPTFTETGASASMKAASHDAGIDVLLTGKDANGKRFQRTAQSSYGAFFTARACWGIERAWHRLPDGTRKLMFTR